MCILSFCAMLCLGGCAHTGKTDASVPERINVAVVAALKASADASGFDTIAKRAVENAEACKNAADDQLSHATSNGNPDQLETAVATAKKATKEAIEARGLAAEVALHAANATNDLAAVKQMAEQAAAGGLSRAAELVSKLLRLSEHCRKESSLAGVLSGKLKKQWLLLVPVPYVTPLHTNAVTTPMSDPVAGDNRRQ
jgi:hypothetical protein